MSEPRTPRWWRALPTWVQAVWLATWLPGVVAHELTHWLVAHGAGDPALDFDRVACEMPQRTSRPLVLALSFIAPLLVGSLLSTSLVLVLAGQPGTVVPLAVLAYVALNLGLYTLASLADLLGAATWVARWWRGRGGGAAVHEHPE
jgi:hypothetical protein